MALLQRKWQDEAQDHLAHQLSGLSREVATIARAVQRFSAEAGHDAGHVAGNLVDEAWHQGERLAHGVRRQARHAGKAVREDPVPAIVAVAGLLLVLSLVLGRKH